MKREKKQNKLYNFTVKMLFFVKNVFFSLIFGWSDLYLVTFESDKYLS